MNVVIVEDELAASDNLTYLLQSIDNKINVIKVLDSVKASISFFSKPQTAELVFMDIHLADGISFDIYEKVKGVDVSPSRAPGCLRPHPV